MLAIGEYHSGIPALHDSRSFLFILGLLFLSASIWENLRLTFIALAIKGEADHAPSPPLQG
jgi:hypothetical protein